MVLADKAYALRAIRDHLRWRGIRAVIPSQKRADQRVNRTRRGRAGWRTATIHLAGLHITGLIFWSAG
ncbi:hypothetical protein GCM10020295_79420 [Streptomyces cinereospinus]